MERKQFFCGDQLPPISTKHPWLVFLKMKAEEDDTEDQIFYSINDPLSQYRCQIPELVGKSIFGCSHGWLNIVDDNSPDLMWSLWNPVTSEIIHLPPLVKNGTCKVLSGWCLSHPPDHPSSILSFTRHDDHTIVFCRLAEHKENRLTWIETSYIEQLKSISHHFVDDDNYFLSSLTSCNGKVYAFSKTYSAIEVNIEVNVVLNVHRSSPFGKNIVVNDAEVVMSLFPFGKLPSPPFDNSFYYYPFLEGYGTDLFLIIVGLDKVTEKPLVYLYKMNTTSMMWKEMEDLKDALFFVELGDKKTAISYMPNIASDLGGYIHIRENMDKVVYFYNVKDKTISISSMPCVYPERYMSLWDCRLPGDHEEIISKQEENMKDEIVASYMDHKVDTYLKNTRQTLRVEENESYLLSLPFDVLAIIMEFSGGVEYLNFRATCKSCLLAAPAIQWNNGNKHRLETYSLVSPWLLVFNKCRGIITFTDPVFGNNYFIKTPQRLIGDLRIHCSINGWLLMEKYEKPLSPDTCVFFINPFTSDIQELPLVTGYVDNFCFSTPPTSPDCVVVAFACWHIHIHFVAHEPYWLVVPIDSIPDANSSLLFPTFCGGDVYALLEDGGLVVFREIEQTNVSCSLVVLSKGRKSCHGSSTKYFLVTPCCQYFLLVTMGKFGKSLEVFMFNDLTTEWEEINSLGRHMIIISDTTCLCIEAKIQEMENKIYFSQVHTVSEKIVFYSLETRRYHTFNDKQTEDGFDNFFGTKYHLYPHTWIEPSWS